MSVIVFNPPCRMCGESSALELSEADAALVAAYRAGEGPIQDLLPEMSVDDRELVKTGIHPACWPQGFDEDPDDYDETSLP